MARRRTVAINRRDDMTRTDIEQVVASVLRSPASGGPEEAAKLIASMLMNHQGFAEEDESVVLLTGPSGPRKWRVVGRFSPTVVKLESVDNSGVLFEAIDSLSQRVQGGSQKLAAALRSVEPLD